MHSTFLKTIINFCEIYDVQQLMCIFANFLLLQDFQMFNNFYQYTVVVNENFRELYFQMTND